MNTSYLETGGEGSSESTETIQNMPEESSESTETPNNVQTSGVLGVDRKLPWQENALVIWVHRKMGVLQDAYVQFVPRSRRLRKEPHILKHSNSSTNHNKSHQAVKLH